MNVDVCVCVRLCVFMRVSVYGIWCLFSVCVCACIFV